MNINKLATLRNARGGHNPDVVQWAIAIEKFGANGITVHPRPDERHITGKDVYDLAKVVTTEYNIEGYPNERFMKLIRETKPAQATLVPDSPEVLTSNAGWDTIKHKSLLKEIVAELKSYGVRTSIFLDPDPKFVEAAVACGTDRIELYTEAFAKGYEHNPNEAIAPYVATAKEAIDGGLEINAGHDLDLNNLAFFAAHIPQLKEVSIGHALVCDALIHGMEKAVLMYQHQLNKV